MIFFLVEYLCAMPKKILQNHKTKNQSLEFNQNIFQALLKFLLFYKMSQIHVTYLNYCDIEKPKFGIAGNRDLLLDKDGIKGTFRVQNMI